MYNKLDIYRKILNLKNINEVVSMLENQDYLDFEYDKYLYNPSIKTDYLLEKSVKKETSKELELAFVKDRYNIMYDMYYSFFDNTPILTSSQYELTDGDTVEISGLLTEEDDGYYYLDMTDPSEIILKNIDSESVITDVELTSATGYFKISKDDYEWVGTSISFDGTSSIITIKDNNLTATTDIYILETDEELDDRITATTEYRKLFLKFIPTAEIFKGTLMYMNFVSIFYYLIKYYNTDLTEQENIDIAEQATIITTNTPIQMNFVYDISSIIPKHEWDIYIKPCVHPHGWIDRYYEFSDINKFIQKEFNNLTNLPTYSDILISKKKEVLMQLCNVKRYGNIETNDDIVSRTVRAGTFYLGGSFNSYEFDHHDPSDDNEKLTTTTENYFIPPPVFSFEGYAYVDGEISSNLLKTIFTISETPNPNYKIENLCCYDIDVLLQDIPATTGDLTDIDDLSNEVAYYGVHIIPGTTAFANPNNYSPLYLQTVIWADDNYDTIITKSDIVSFDMERGKNQINPNPVINPTQSDHIK